MTREHEERIKEAIYNLYEAIGDEWVTANDLDIGDAVTWCFGDVEMEGCEIIDEHNSKSKPESEPTVSMKQLIEKMVAFAEKRKTEG